MLPFIGPEVDLGNRDEGGIVRYGDDIAHATVCLLRFIALDCVDCAASGDSGLLHCS